MVSFISGRASSGKTYEVYKRISELAKQKESIVLVVPEQFSFETEKAMLDLLGEASLNYVSVLPFSRIYETVGRLTGGICGTVLTAADKHILIDRAISSVAGELSLWKKYSSSMHFSSQMLNSIDEFKYAGINSVDLKNAAECVVNKKLKQKLSDTAVIYEAYTSLLGTAFLDPSDYMDRLYDMLEKCNYFEDKNVFFDGFKSFSGQQFKVIDRIVSAAKNTVFTFVDDKNDTRRFSILANVRKTKNRVLRILEAHNLTLREDIYLETNNYKSRDLVSLEKALFSGEFSDGSPKSDITVCEAETIYDEAEYTARTIRKLVREEDASYSDFVVIARDTTTYEDALTISCKRNKVNVFIDKKIALSTMPISKLIISAIEYTKKATTESIIDFYKTGITGVAFDDISEVEQYCVIWNIKAKDFENEWDMNPDGLTDRISEDIDEKLSRLNDIREKMLAPLKEFKSSFSGTPKQRAKAIFALLNSLDVPKNLSELCEHYKGQGEFEFADVLRQSYSQFISLLDNVVACFPDTVVSKPVFFDALKTVLSLNSVGVVPQTLDEVVFGSAERIRPARPKYVFILGANQGIYPRLKVSTGLFTNNDLTTLKDFGLDISNKTLDLSVDEQFLIYSNLCCASDKVFITYCKNLSDNTPALPSRFVTQILELNVNRVFEPSDLNVGNLPETLNCAVLERFKRINDKTPDSQTIYEAIAVECKRDNINLDKYEISAENSKLSESVVRDFCGNKIRLSATSLERYSMCHFMYFCRHIANAQNRDKAEISPMNRGTIVHFVLEKILAEYKEDISKLTPAEISDGVDKFCDDYLDSIPGYRSVETERLKYLIYSIRRIIKDVVTRIALEFEQSKFKPSGFELKIEDNCPVRFSIDDNCEIELKGSVDRIDVFENNVRIVDYKTGVKKFKLAEILEGINMQMLIYLYAVKESNLFGDNPAGILYSHAARTSNEKQPANGLILSDPDIVTAMEKENKGEFIPAYKEKKPSDSFISKEDFSSVLDFVNKKLISVGKDILSGDISARPLYYGKLKPCEYCDFAGVCRINENAKRIIKKIEAKEAIEKIKGEESDGI